MRPTPPKQSDQLNEGSRAAEAVLDERERPPSEIEPDAALPRAARSHRGRRAASAAVALAVAGAGVVLVAQAFRRGEGPVGPGGEPQASMIAFNTLNQGWRIAVVDPDGGSQTVLTGPTAADGTELDIGPRWSPEGTRIAFAGYTNVDPETGQGDYELFVMDADGSGMTNLTGDSGAVSYTWSPDGSAIAYSALRGPNDLDLWIIAPDGTGGRSLTEGPATDGSPAWSPDGSRIAFTRGRDIYTVDPSGGSLARLTEVPGYVGPPVWSPDGTRIAFVSNRDGGLQVYVMNADGTALRRITDVPTDRRGCCIGGEPSWSPDGTLIAFTVWDPQGEDWDLWLVGADGTGQRRLTDDPGAEGGAVWSPDGTRIAFAASPRPSGEEGTYEIHVMNPDGTGRTKLTEGARTSMLSMAWQPLRQGPEEDEAP